jgi:hypothetical protein
MKGRQLDFFIAPILWAEERFVSLLTRFALAIPAYSYAAALQAEPLDQSIEDAWRQATKLNCRVICTQRIGHAPSAIGVDAGTAAKSANHAHGIWVRRPLDRLAGS